MKAGFFQFSPVFGDKDANMKKVSAAVADIELDLLVLPELFSTGYQFRSRSEVEELSEHVPDGPTVNAMIELSQSKNMHIVAGIAENSNGILFNSAVLTGPSGFIGLYRKAHLFYEETLFFTPGDTGFKVWDTAAGRIGVMICFDWFFPESMRLLAIAGADIVAHPANLVLPYCPKAMPVRCLENRVFAVTANRTGVEQRTEEALKFTGQSQIVSPKGEILAQASGESEELVVIGIDPLAARDKSLNHYNNLFSDRRTDLYGRVCRIKDQPGQM